MRPLITALFVIGLLSAPVEAADRYLVATRGVSTKVLRETESHEIRAFESVNAFAANLTAAEVAELTRSGQVRFITPVVERHASVEGALQRAPNGSIYTTAQMMPFGVAMVHAPELWPLTKGAGPVNVAVLDTGIDALHPDLATNYAGGYNTFTKTNDPADDNGHGTHVAGTIAAADNNIGVVGVAPEVRLWAVKVLDRTGFGLDENVIAGVDWVINKKHEIGGDWIMSLSLGASFDSPVEREAFARVIAEGILVTAAAGNRGSTDIEYPAAYDGVIAVGAIDSADKLAAFSDHGPRLDVVAPGVRVLSTAPRGSIPVAAVTLMTGATLTAATIQGSSRGEVKGEYVACGIGNPQDFPSAVSGKIALIRRGEITFNEKVRNAQAAGAVSVVVFNQDDSAYSGWTLLRPNCGSIPGCDDDTHQWPVVLAISAADGQRVINDTEHMMDMGAWLDDYMTLSGTSQATPHVAGALALVWSIEPAAPANRVKEALLSSTVDLGTPGFDLIYGYGLINAFEAAKQIAPWRFEPPAMPPVPDRLPSIP
ncbi:MAG: hypothetical protein DMF58_07190 [Acidobacteria bacterium]|nr:MAG: hypothetical protein DMF58_07190 [Acidobacteriota bacterium]